MQPLTYNERISLTSHPLSRHLFQLLEKKKTNLALSADVTQKAQLLKLADELGPEICVLKTHIDIIEDFDHDLITQLKKLAHQHQFLLFEDRKFADIGNTVQLQYRAGIYRIAEWADIVNAHSLPGPGIIKGLNPIDTHSPRGLLLLAQISSSGNLIDETYIKKTVAMAEQNKDFVMGFIAQQQLSEDPALITMTPGIGVTHSSDNLGQNYIHPEIAITERGSDIIIVGRHIYQAPSPKEAAKQYRELGWNAYLKRN